MMDNHDVATRISPPDRKHVENTLEQMIRLLAREIVKRLRLSSDSTASQANDAGCGDRHPGSPAVHDAGFGRSLMAKTRRPKR
jgi:hypothetical protein